MQSVLEYVYYIWPRRVPGLGLDMSGYTSILSHMLGGQSMVTLMLLERGPQGVFWIVLGSHQPSFVKVLWKLCRRPPTKLQLNTSIKVTQRLPWIGHLKQLTKCIHVCFKISKCVYITYTVPGPLLLPGGWPACRKDRPLFCIYLVPSRYVYSFVLL